MVVPIGFENDSGLWLSPKYCRSAVVSGTARNAGPLRLQITLQTVLEDHNVEVPTSPPTRSQLVKHYCLQCAGDCGSQIASAQHLKAGIAKEFPQKRQQSWALFKGGVSGSECKGVVGRDAIVHATQGNALGPMRSRLPWGTSPYSSGFSLRSQLELRTVV